jgi:CBS domain-containing protein
MKLRDVMTSNPRTVPPDATIQETARLMRDEDTGAIPVVDKGKPVGIITDRDIVVRALADGDANIRKPVRNFITESPVTVDLDTSTEEAAKIMGERQIRRLLVSQDDKVVGIVSIGDLAVREGGEEHTGEALKDISKPGSRG